MIVTHSTKNIIILTISIISLENLFSQYTCQVFAVKFSAPASKEMRLVAARLDYVGNVFLSEQQMVFISQFLERSAVLFVLSVERTDLSTTAFYIYTMSISTFICHLQSELGNASKWKIIQVFHYWSGKIWLRCPVNH